MSPLRLPDKLGDSQQLLLSEREPPPPQRDEETVNLPDHTPRGLFRENDYMSKVSDIRTYVELADSITAHGEVKYPSVRVRLGNLDGKFLIAPSGNNRREKRYCR